MASAILIPPSAAGLIHCSLEKLLMANASAAAQFNVPDHQFASSQECAERMTTTTTNNKPKCFYVVVAAVANCHGGFSYH